MTKVAIMKSATRAFNKISIKVKKHSPEILVVAGVTGVVASTVMACKATTKVNDILVDAKKQINDVHTVLADEKVSEETYSVEDSKKDLAIIYTQTAVKFIKLYGPSFLLGSASISCILASHSVLRKRNIALAAAYATIDKGFKEYRGRVLERFGKDVERELRYNIKAKEVEEVTVDKKGNEHAKKKIVNVIEGENGPSDYAKFYDDGCLGWSKDPEYNLMFLRRQQDHANEILKSRGYLFLNEVYTMLGIDMTKAGQCVGWIYDEKTPTGDNYVDFGIYDLESCNASRKIAFVNGYERTILLDFNVDGPILDML